MDQLNVVFEMDTMDLSCNSKDTKEMKMVETPAEIIKDLLRPNFSTQRTAKDVPTVLIRPIPIATIAGCPIDIFSRRVTAQKDIEYKPVIGERKRRLKGIRLALRDVLEIPVTEDFVDFENLKI